MPVSEEDRAKVRRLIEVCDGLGTAREARESSGLSPAQVRRLTGISVERLEAIERGEATADEKFVLCNLYRVPDFK